VSRTVDFNPLAQAYERYRVGYGDEVFAAIARRLDPVSPRAVLDLACGTGLSTTPLARLVESTVVGVDIAAELLRRAPKKSAGQPITYVRAQAARLPFADAAFQAVTCAQAMHWMVEGEVMPEARRVLAPGGWFFAYWKYPAADEPYQQLANRVLTDVLGRPVESRYTLSVPPDLTAAGLENVAREDFELMLPYTVEEYVGFMRSRRRILDLAGAQTGEFLKRYAVELAKLRSGEERFDERNIVSLFSGRRP
jgi:SAM-dependent methyltransferase